MERISFILISTVLVNNFVLVKFLGLCPFIGVSKRFDGALGLALATGFVLTLSAGLSYLVFHFILQPLQLEYLRTLAFILLIAAAVQLTETIMHKAAPVLYSVLGIYLPLITTNCAVLGVALLNVNETTSLLEAIIYGLGASIGFALVLILFSAIRERLAASDIPSSFKGAPIALITAGMMALAFMGFGGIVAP